MSPVQLEVGIDKGFFFQYFSIRPPILYSIIGSVSVLVLVLICRHLARRYTTNSSTSFPPVSTDTLLDASALEKAITYYPSWTSSATNNALSLVSPYLMPLPSQGTITSGYLAAKIDEQEQKTGKGIGPGKDKNLQYGPLRRHSCPLGTIREHEDLNLHPLRAASTDKVEFFSDATMDLVWRRRTLEWL